MMWKTKDQVEVVNYSQKHILIWVKDITVNANWLLTEFYGEPKTSKRQKTRSLLKELKPINQSPWMVIGDFNEILFPYEKVGER